MGVISLAVSEKNGDTVYTPDWCAEDMVRFFRPSGRILEPCKGLGAFMKHLPPETFWCELELGVDFFEWKKEVDWIITNPPYSKTRLFMKHAFKVSKNVVYLIPARNLFSGYGTVREAKHYGGMKNLRWYGTGGSLGFPMGNAIAAVHWQKGYIGPTHQTFYEDEKNQLKLTV
jgi:hypothetical protein